MLGHELRKLIVVICPYTPPQLLYAVYADAGRCTRKGRVDSAAQLSNNSSFGHYVLLIFVRLGNTHESREPLKRQLPPQFRVRLTRQRVMREVEHFLWLNQQLARRKGRDCHRCGSEPLHTEKCGLLHGEVHRNALCFWRQLLR